MVNINQNFDNVNNFTKFVSSYVESKIRSINSPEYELCFTGHNFIGYKFNRDVFRLTFNAECGDRKVGVFTGWYPSVLYDNESRTVVNVYCHGNENVELPIKQIADVITRSALYSLFIHAAIDFKKISSDLARTIFSEDNPESDDLHILAIKARTINSVSFSSCNYDETLQLHCSTLNSKLFQNAFEFQALKRNCPEIESVLLSKRSGQQELKSHLLGVLRNAE